MKMLRIVAAGALSYFAYRAWKRNRDEQDAEPRVAEPLTDDGARTAPHGDPLLDVDDTGQAGAPRAAAHSSQGFGAP